MLLRTVGLFKRVQARLARGQLHGREWFVVRQFRECKLLSSEVAHGVSCRLARAYLVSCNHLEISDRTSVGCFDRGIHAVDVSRRRVRVAGLQTIRALDAAHGIFRVQRERSFNLAEAQVLSGLLSANFELAKVSLYNRGVGELVVAVRAIFATVLSFAAPTIKFKSHVALKAVAVGPDSRPHIHENHFGVSCGALGIFGDDDVFIGLLLPISADLGDVIHVPEEVVSLVPVLLEGDDPRGHCHAEDNGQPHCHTSANCSPIRQSHNNA